MGRRDLAKALIIVALALGLGVPMATGALKPLIVLSSSMEPVMSPGDMVIIREAEPQDIDRGDIMAFEDPSGRANVLVTHRVINISREGGTLTFKTKGDAVEDPDPFTVKGPDVVGRAVFEIPFLGYLFHYGRRPEAFLLLVLAPAALIILGEIRKIAKYADPIRAHEAEVEDRRGERKFERRRVDYKIVRMTCILLISLTVFGLISLPRLQESGRDLREGRISGGFIPTVAVYRVRDNSIPQYRIVSRGENAVGPGRVSMISAAPYIIPPFLVGALAEVDPNLPSTATFLLPPLLLTLILYPIWRRVIRLGRPQGGRRRP